jgi:hypothetical protein
MASAFPPGRQSAASRDEIKQMLAAHRLYLEMQWRQGYRANPRGRSLGKISGLNSWDQDGPCRAEGADFTGTHLQRQI